MWVGSRRGRAPKSGFQAVLGDTLHRSPRPTRDWIGDHANGHQYGLAYGLRSDVRGSSIQELNMDAIRTLGGAAKEAAAGTHPRSPVRVFSNESYFPL